MEKDMLKIPDFFQTDYRNIKFDTRLYELFCKNDAFVEAYIKVGRKFWHYDDKNKKWRMLTVTYVRTGVMFFIFDDEPDVEFAFFIRSFHCLMMRAAEIYPNEISKIMAERYPDNDFAEIARFCKWDDCDGKIDVKVIWNNV